MHLLDKFRFCPLCGSNYFVVNNEKSKRCETCGFIYYMNPSAATAAFIINEHEELLVERRANDPGKGTLDLPGGFSDCYETAEEGIAREIEEETGLRIEKADYLFSLPNIYPYSGVEIHTLDLFFRCSIDSRQSPRPADDAAECLWIPLAEIDIEKFGLPSIRQALSKFINELRESTLLQNERRSQKTADPKAF